MHAVLPSRPHQVALRGLIRRPSSYRLYAPLSSATCSTGPNGHGVQQLAFTDHRTIYEHLSTDELCRSLLVLRLCAFPPFVRRSEWLLGGKPAPPHGHAAPQRWLRGALHNHFCAGHSAADVWARMNALRAHGVGAILEPAEEEEEGEEEELGDGATAEEVVAEGDAAVAAKSRSPTPMMRLYDQRSEAAYERQVRAAIASVDQVAALPGQGFAAAKLTALGDPALLGHLAAALTVVHSLFEQYDSDGDGLISRAEFEAGYRRLAEATGCAGTAAAAGALLPGRPSEDGTLGGGVDYLGWVRRLDGRLLAALAAGLQRGAAHATGEGGARPRHLTAAEGQRLDAMMGRLGRLVERAVSKGVKLLIEGEASGLRPALEHIAHGLMRQHNRAAAAAGPAAGPAEAAVFLTYPAHQRGTRERLAADLARAQGQGYTLGARLVSDDTPRLTEERASETGSETGSESGSGWDRRHADADAAFASCLGLLLGAVKAGGAEVVVGSHRQAGVEAAVAMMSRLGLEPGEAPVYFAQRLGMADCVSFTLGHHGYKVFKHCPVGDANKVVPYLVRRIHDTQYALQVGRQDLHLAQAELWRRLLHEPTALVAAKVASLLVGGGAGSGARSVTM